MRHVVDVLIIFEGLAHMDCSVYPIQAQALQVSMKRYRYKRQMFTARFIRNRGGRLLACLAADDDD
jgi:hypothetical protein